MRHYQPTIKKIIISLSVPTIIFFIVTLVIESVCARRMCESYCYAQLPYYCHLTEGAEFRINTFVFIILTASLIYIIHSMTYGKNNIAH